MRKFIFIACIMAVTLPLIAEAEQSQSFGDYTIHYSAFTTDTLTPDVAKLYQIPRSKNRAMVNISVLKNESGTIGKPVRAKVEGTAKNLSEQLRELQIREIDEQESVYYIAETAVNDNETLKYTFEITPEGKGNPYTLSFQEQFYTE
ncbi:MAG: hypothetical protein HW411_257 [Gammaproteobacteria bacterium]|nr:hypothetical protein [Gammaproteobacteria bacterium]